MAAHPSEFSVPNTGVASYLTLQPKVETKFLRICDDRGVARLAAEPARQPVRLETHQANRVLSVRPNKPNRNDRHSSRPIAACPPISRQSRRRAIAVNDPGVEQAIPMELQHRGDKNGGHAAIAHHPPPPSAVDARVMDLRTAFAILFDRQLLPLALQI
jgi:hypothetical protein